MIYPYSLELLHWHWGDRCINGSVQDCSISSADALVILQFALNQQYDCPIASELSLNDMDKTDW